MRDIPDDNLAYPVLVTFPKGGPGSGFYLNGLDSIFFVTAKHVLLLKNGSLRDSSAILLSYPADLNDPGTIKMTLDLKALESSGNMFPHPDRDVILVRIFKIQRVTGTPGFTSEPLDGVGVNRTAKSGFVGVHWDNIKPSEKVLVANEVLVFGYPVSIGLKQNPQWDYQRPLLRKGIVASKYPKQGTIILDCQLYPGNSGGPVLELEQVSFQTTQFRIIGVISQFIPYVKNQQPSNSGYSVAVDMNSVLELIPKL